MTEKATETKPKFSADWLFRGALTRIGDTFDRFTGRKWIPSSSLATSELIERIKKVLINLISMGSRLIIKLSNAHHV